MPNATELVVIEITRSVAGAACGRLFAALGHHVTMFEPPAGHPLRERGPLFAALAAGKHSVVVEPSEWSERLASADVVILDLPPSEARALDLDHETLSSRHPALVTVSLSTFNPHGELADLEGDSLLAEAFGGLAHMIGEPDRAPLALGGEQAAYAAAFVGLFGASLAIVGRARSGHGDVIEVTTSDVAAYMDWKSDVTYHLSGVAPHRTGASLGAWRVVEAKDGWIGVIFLPDQWPAVVELVGDERLADPALRDTATRLARADQVWPVIAEAIRQREARDVFVAAQRLGLPFGYAVAAADLFESEQLLERGFLVPADQRRPDAPVVAFPLPGQAARTPESAPRLDQHGPVQDIKPVPDRHSSDLSPGAPLDGLIVLDFGTITAGAATARLLSDYGATVIKIESEARPDRFRHWTMPGADAAGGQAVSPMFLSNNAGKTGACFDLKAAGGRQAVHELIRRADILVENFRVGVTERMGIDPATAHDLNPDLVYVSLSSQGSEGPESQYASYGSTLDLLSGLASVTGYPGANPLWSSGDVNYPDQVVALAGAAFATHAVATGRRGAWLDISQRELVAWTLADRLAAYVFDSVPLEPTGNRRPHATPHDVYAAKDGEWLAIACSTAEHRRALARLIPGLGGAAEEADDAWWSANEDAIDELITEWSLSRRRDDAAGQLRAAGVPAVPVNTAADRARQPHRAERRLSLRSHQGEWLKGFPLVMHRFTPPVPGPAPDLGTDIPDTTDPRFQQLLDLIERTRKRRRKGCT
jgi:crotonobetainyl-CoA:carnitine CoA-transferase CaiB-like acyl-CoA transferase